MFLAVRVEMASHRREVGRVTSSYVMDVYPMDTGRQVMGNERNLDTTSPFGRKENRLSNDPAIGAFQFSPSGVALTAIGCGLQ